MKSIVYIYHVFIFCSSVEGHLGFSHFVALVNMETMKFSEQASVGKNVESFGHKPRSGVVVLVKIRIHMEVKPLGLTILPTLIIEEKSPQYQE